MNPVRFAFVVRILSNEARAASALASALAPALEARSVMARVEEGERPLPGTVAAIGVLDPEGVPRWLAPLPADGTADEAAASVIAFLERWGFMPAATRPAA